VTNFFRIFILAMFLSSCMYHQDNTLGKEGEPELNSTLNTNKDFNHLSSQKSPYLLQHADNPVNWYPWGDAAFDKAKREDKPIFLSIGYSTCHWCHVMEHESFENHEIAEILNKYFVSIKVDREERPDIDNVYMKVVMALTGSGGWPLTVFLTPEKKPFYGGTYFPPESRWGAPGFKDVLLTISDEWVNKKEGLQKTGQDLVKALNKAAKSKTIFKVPLNKSILSKAFLTFKQIHDPLFGGFGRAPKFPSSHNLSFLLRHWKRTNDQEALNMVILTLNKMASGGIHDHIGGGFHRYTTDQIWHIPHFEKMLYDQAMLSKIYLEAYQVTKKESYDLKEIWELSRTRQKEDHEFV